MSGLAWLVLTYSATAVSLAVFVYRTVKLARLPIHLRWELAPVPSERGKGHYGGSYLEEYEWWKRTRKKSLANEILYIAKEVFLFKGVWENNRSLWPFSFSLHTAIYLLLIMGFFLLLAGVSSLAGISVSRIESVRNLAAVLAVAGYTLGSVGTVGLTIKRATDADLRSLNALSTYTNLLLLGAVFLTGLYSFLVADDFVGQLSSFIRNLMSFNTGFMISLPVSIHVVCALIFIVYLPFTYMIHFVAKFFAYHAVRWNDKPMDEEMEREVVTLLNRAGGWSAKHIEGDGQGKWIEAVSGPMRDEEDT